eukprot:TRINITY_DN5471_c0_g1_i1.p1 TRINITY_DN5471_c0_g1~~TRINITY_DN5471_c0_g1_i1.p1  ORF type:complete len:3987 (-),score=1077.90 TRINITY_DN5471_c0_g1_i1:1263-13184(-)
MAVVASDARSVWLCDVVDNFFFPLAEDATAPRSIAADAGCAAALADFLDTLSCCALVAFAQPTTASGAVASGAQRSVHLSNTFEELLRFVAARAAGVEKEKAARARALVFVKPRPQVLTEDNLDTAVTLVSVPLPAAGTRLTDGNAAATPKQSLLQLLAQVFEPLMAKDESQAPAMQKLLKDLESLLSEDVSNTSSFASADEIPNAHTFAEEYTYWTRLSQDMQQKQDVSDRAAYIAKELKPMYDGLVHLKTKNVAEVIELLEGAHDCFDKIWKMKSYASLSDERMSHIFAVVGEDIVAYLQYKLASFRLWTDQYQTIRDSLRKSTHLLEKWTAITDSLTGQHWPQYAAHRWQAPRFGSEIVDRLRERLEEIQHVRSVYGQVTSLLPRERQPINIFVAFESMDVLQCSTHTLPRWQAAVAEFEKALQPAEVAVAQILQGSVTALAQQPYQLLKEFQKYQDLISRPAVAKLLANERERFLGQLISYVTSMRDEFSKRAEEMLESDQKILQIGRNVPDIVNNIVWARQLLSKVETASSTAHALLHDLGSYGTLHGLVTPLIADLKAFQKEQFTFWCQNMQGFLAKPDQHAMINLQGQLIQIQNGKAEVNFHQRLVSLLREARQLTALGFKIPPDIRMAAENAGKFHRHGVVLKQVANFYNTLTVQIIDSQKGMLLQLSKEFESLVRLPFGKNAGDKQVTWHNASDVEMYVDKLQKVTDRITSENRMLRKMHASITEKVMQLMNTDLLRNTDKWNRTVREIRADMDVLERKGYQHMEPWRLHWDHQLYKALEYQYKRGLLSLSDTLTDITCELTCKDQQLQFRPKFEVLRTNYYSVIQNYIKYPLRFPGVSGAGKGANPIFRGMVEQNASSLVAVYKRAEELFQRLKKEKEQFAEWVVLGSVDVAQMVQQHIQEPEDWEFNFRMLKTRGRQIEKLPNEKQIGCINVSFGPVKSTVEVHLQRLSDALMGSLTSSIQVVLQEVDQFLNQSLAQLGEAPSSSEKIAEANMLCSKIRDACAEVERTLKKAERKNKILRSVSGTGIDMAAVAEKWALLEDTLDGHKQMIEKRVKILREEVDKRILSLTTSVANFSQDWEKLKPSQTAIGDSESAMAAINTMEQLRKKFNELREQAARVLEESLKFDMGDRAIPGMEDLEQEISDHEVSWNLYKQFTEEKVALASKAWVEYRSSSMGEFDDFIVKWETMLKKSAKQRGSRDSITSHLRSLLVQYRELVPLLRVLRGDNYTNEHWKELFSLLHLTVPSVNELKFEHYLNASAIIVANVVSLKELQSRAQGEATIRDAMEELKAWGSNAKFSMFAHEEEGRSTPLIKDWRELFTAIGDNQALLSSLKDSSFFKPFADYAKQWEQKLSLLDEYTHSLNLIQRKWLYLEPIFAHKGLPQEEARFHTIDTRFVEIVEDLASNPNVLRLVEIPGVKDTLEMLQDQLDRCQNALSAFLEEKRSRFPRFYFLGDDDLLEILGQSRNPAVIQTHLKKLFQGLHMVEFSADSRRITAMKSAAGEVVPLDHAVDVTDQVETWLHSLAAQMKVTLKALLERCLKLFDPSAYPSQILSLADSVLFTNKCELAVTSGSGGGKGQSKHKAKHAVAALMDELNGTLGQYTLLDTSSDHVLGLKIKSLILDIIHNRDVIDQLTEPQVQTLNDWIWKKQLRYYYEGGSCRVRMGEASIDYSYEYQGNAPKLVYTPLTDKCYLTLTQGIVKGFGGNPYGPAGTGKTESVKALGQILGRQVLVFNCDEGIDVKSMGRMFTGLVRCGAWGCFDEFNRLDEDVLSAVSQQIQLIQGAMKVKLSKIVLLGKDVDVDHAAGIFVTMNPAGKGYGGRSKLPDNLKQLFRPVAMSIPDLNMIAEVILLSEGFSYAKEVALKLVTVFRLCKQLLSPQQHYDWGLRALKSILSIGGATVQEMKKAEREKRFNKDGKPFVVDQLVEQSIVVRALRSSTTSKLVRADVQRFQGLIADVFCDKEAEMPSESEDLMRCVNDCFLSQNLVPNARQVAKILQLHECLRQRTGVVVVGPSGSGKSTLWRVLAAALQEANPSHIAVKKYTMNPKAVPRRQLLGSLDSDTREWTDGILSGSCRQVTKEPPEVRSWIICDGDIDPKWIESLNSVLDDNRLLTLPNGERMQFGSNVNFIFETDSMKYASPATVSRMGMIFLSDDDVDIKALVHTWMARQVKDTPLPSEFTEWIDKYFYKAVDAVRGIHSVVPTTLVGLVKSGLAHLTGVRNRLDFALGLLRGLGGNLPLADRAQFGCTIFSWFGENPTDRKRPWECYVDPRNGFVAPFKLTILDFTLSDLNNEAMVATVEAQGNASLLLPCLRNAEPVILVGPEGCGKNMLLKHCFSQLKSVCVATLHCSSRTNASHVIQKLNQSCVVQSSTSGRVYRPKESERLILYLKDINLPKPDKFATMQLISFLQQLICYGGFFDDKCERLSLERIQIVCSMTPATAGRHPLSTRFTANARIFFVDYPDKAQLQEIYAIYLGPVIRECVKTPMWKQASNIPKLAATMVHCYSEVRRKFTTEQFAHYIFTPRDLTNWTLGLLRYEYPESLEFFEVWKHEGCRIFKDRLVGEGSQRFFDTVVDTSLKTDWQMDIDLKGQFFTTLASETGRRNRKLGKTPRKKVDSLVEKNLAHYERDVRDLRLVLFPEVIDHVLRVDRVFSSHGGSLLLVGKSGVGRRSAVSLVAFMHRMKLVSPNVNKTYNLKSFTTDLKQVLNIAGVEGEHVAFVLEDHQILEPDFLECINSLLSAGEVPGLYAPEELDTVLAPLKDECVAQGFFGGLFSFFVSRVRQNLHVALLMDDSGREFTSRCQANPALYTKCSIQWWGQWSAEGTGYVPTVFLSEVFPDAEITKTAAITNQFIQIHKSMEGRGATPRTFMSFLNVFKTIFTSKVQQAQNELGSLKGGLAKLVEASETVDSLSRDAAVNRDQLQKAKARANEMMKQIEEKMQDAATKREEMKQLSDQLQGEKQKTQNQKEVIEEKLSKIQPILDQARLAVEGIQKRNIDDIRILQKPSQTIGDIMEGVVRLLGHTEVSWNSIRNFLAKPGVVSDIVHYDPSSVSPEVRAAVEAHLKDKKASFEHEKAMFASQAAGPLAQWVKAVVSYAQVKHSIAPLEGKLAKANKKLLIAEKKITTLQINLEELNGEIEKMRQQYQEITEEAMKHKIALDDTERVLNQAQMLMGKLGGEHARWEARAKEIEEQLRDLPAGSVLAAAFITYMGGASEDERQGTVEKWKEISNLKGWCFTRFMSTETEIVTMRKDKLPTDDLSTENALIIKWTPGVPFIIDPSSTSIEWLKAYIGEQTNRFEVMTQEDPKFVNKLELAIRFGKTLLIQEVDKIHPILFPVLRQDFIKQGPQLSVQIGDKAITFSEDFHLYLSTRDPQPDLSPDSRALICEVNFTVTRSGLEGQLLGITLQNEKPKLEQEKMASLLQEEKNKQEMVNLEAQLLEQLGQAKGNVLQNQQLLDSLNETKRKSAEIEKSLAASQQMQEELDRQRNVYRRIAKYGSALFFVLTDLGKINHMYHFSLNSFLPLFHKALKSVGPTTAADSVTAERADVTVKRIDAITDTLKRYLFDYVTRSLFKADRLMFAMHLVHSIETHLFQPKEWELFTGLLAGAAYPKSDRFPTWAPKDRAAQFAELDANLPKVIVSMSLTDSEWTGWSIHSECETAFPQKIKGKCTPFQRLLLLKALRPDRLESAMSIFCGEALHLPGLAPPALSLHRLYNDGDTSAGVPTLLITTPGADPSQELEELAERVVASGNCTAIAMGQGQQDAALAAVRHARRDGTWVVLKNLHLAVSWLPALEMELNAPELPHDSFRLWLTTEPHPKFSTILLQNSTKITYEAPPGLKKNLERTYESWGADFIAKGGVLRAQTLFVLAWFHAVVQERRKFIPQGWTKFYEFNEGDLRAAAEMIDKLVQQPVPFTVTSTRAPTPQMSEATPIDLQVDGYVSCLCPGFASALFSLIRSF